MLARSFPRASLEAGSLLPGYPLENDVERVFENVSVRLVFRFQVAMKVKPLAQRANVVAMFDSLAN